MFRRGIGVDGHLHGGRLEMSSAVRGAFQRDLLGPAGFNQVHSATGHDADDERGGA